MASYTGPTRGMIVKGDKTTAGGVVIEGSDKSSIKGSAVALQGHKIDCPACGTTGHIELVPPFAGAPVYGVEIALSDDLCICGCNPAPKLISSNLEFAWHGFSAEELGDPAAAPWLKHAGYDPAQYALPFDEQFLLQDANGKALAGVYFSVKLPSGKVVHGTTSSSGLTSRYETEGAAHIEVYLGHIGVKFPAPLIKATTNIKAGSVVVAKSERLAKPWKASKRGIDFVVSFEKAMTKVYPDQAGLPTIGIGHLITPAEKAAKTFDNGLTDKQVVDLFAQDFPRYESRASEGVYVPLYQHEFDALASLAYNTWSALGAHSSIAAMLNAGQYSDVQTVVLEYCKVRDQVTHQLAVSTGLLKRRKAEVKIFNDATYEMHQ